MSIDARLFDHGLDPVQVRRIIAAAIAEDLGDERRDPTSQAIFGAERAGHGKLVARQAGVSAGLPVAHAVFAEVAKPTTVTFDYRVSEGAQVLPGDVLAEVSGPVVALLMAERTALNLLSRICGVASHTKQWTDALAGYACTVLDTRKTTPGLRILDKYAVRAGGGENKRMGLFDVAMIKDNHKLAAGSITAAFNAVRANSPGIDIQVEVDTLDEATEAVEAGARFLLCDNMTPAQVAEVVAKLGDAAQLEATGKITLDAAKDFAAAGANYVSSGALTHSSPIMDIALDM